MADLLDLHKTLIASFVDALGIHDPNAILSKLLDDLKLAEVNGVDSNAVTKGSDILLQLKSAQPPLDTCRDLIQLCGDYDNGLELLRIASQSPFRSSSKRHKFLDALKAYAQRLDNQPLLFQDVAKSTLREAADLSYLDAYQSVDLEIARRILEEMSRPGEPFALQSQGGRLALPGPNEPLKPYLKQILADCPRPVVEVFRSRVQLAKEKDSKDDIAETSAFLMVLVEPAFNERSEPCYQFRAELEMERLTASFDAKRASDGRWQKGTMDDFPLIVGQWIVSAKASLAGSPYAKLYLEIFLPHKLFVESPSIQICIPRGEQWKPLDLCSCGTPAVVRSLDRAQKAKQRQLGDIMRKWERLRSGEAKLHPVANGTQLRSHVLHPRLCTDRIAGMLLLLDLPAETEDRSDLFWEVIETGIPLCTWWRRRRGTDGEGDASRQTAARLDYLTECLKLTGKNPLLGIALQQERPIEEVADLEAPRHLHSMETAAKQLLELAGQQSCEDWIPGLMLLIDHPKRWPKVIDYESKEGGALKSPD